MCWPRTNWGSEVRFPCPRAERPSEQGAYRAARRGVFLLSALCGFALGACQERRLTKANVDQVTDGMAKKQVESILGVPTRVETKDFAVMRKTTYFYAQGQDTITITFKEDKVESRESSLTK